VTVTTLPAAGTLKLNGVAVTAGDSVTVADITGGLLKFTPAPNTAADNYATFTFQVKDDGGTANGGADTDPTPNTITVDVDPVNIAPAGADKTLTTNEDVPVVFTAADFGFSDLDGNTLAAVKIATLPAAGTLTNNGVAVNAGDFVSVGDINAGRLQFTPALNASGTGYASFTFQVQDNGGTANGGIDLDQSADTITLDVNPSNDAPAGTNVTKTLTEDGGAYTIAVADFGFSDAVEGNAFAAVKITTLPGAGTLALDGTPVAAGDVVSVADITANKLVFTPAANGNGAPYATFTFQVQDDGGTATGGVDTDQTPNTFRFDVTSVNDEPAGADNTVATDEDTAYTFTAADFGFADTADGNALLAVKITSLPSDGTLTNNGVAVALNAFVPVGDITGGKLKFEPAANASGASYASFTFQVQDDGGTANGGLDLDQTPNTITVAVNAVNDAPVNTVPAGPLTVAEDTDLAITGLSLADVDSDPALVKVTLTVANGTITVLDNVPGGLDSSEITGNGTNSVTLECTVATINTTLAAAGGVIYRGDLDFNGSDTLSMTSNDGGANGTDPGGADPNSEEDVDLVAINVTAANDAPTGADTAKTILEGGSYTFATADFGFADASDSPANALLAVKITTLPGAGSLTNNGVAVNAGDSVSAADIGSGLLVFTPAANGNGTPYASFTFQVQDNGGTANGGVDLDQTPNTFDLNVTGINNEPAGADKTVTANEDAAYAFTAADFGFTDSLDGNALLAVKIATLPAAGTLTNNGVAVNAGDFIPVADITGGKLQFKAALNASGAAYAAFTFQVQDNGGTSNGGVDLDQSANTITVDVNAVNDAPHAILGGPFAINENSGTGTVVGTVTGQDIDNATLTYSLVDSASGRYAINAAGQISVADAVLLDFEQGTGQAIKVRVTDAGGLFFDKTIVINLNDINPETAGGGAGDDLLIGGSAGDTIGGNGGHDVLIGGGGDDYMFGADGNDKLFGDTGKDTLIGGDGNDYLNGGADDDLVVDGQGNDTLFGDTGNDYLNGGLGDDLIGGGEGNDTVIGDFGNDYLNGGTGDDLIGGGDGNDILIGDIGNDYLNGGVGDDIIGGGEGNDTVIGDAGNDYLSAGPGDDVLGGGDGNDSLFAGSGSDYLVGGAGDDFFIFDGAFQSSVVVDFTPGPGLSGHDVIQFGPDVFDSFDDMMAHAIQSSTSVLITTDGGAALTLVNTLKTSLLADDFRFG
jgi:hypothetical protein